MLSMMKINNNELLKFYENCDNKNMHYMTESDQILVLVLCYANKNVLYCANVFCAIYDFVRWCR